MNSKAAKYGIKLVSTTTGREMQITKEQFGKMVKDYPSLIHCETDLQISRSTLRRWKAKWPDVAWETNTLRGDLRTQSNALKLIEQRYTREELDALAKGRSTPVVNSCRKLVDFSRDILKIGYCTDTHMGAKTFSENWFASMWAEFNKEKIDIALHTGDVFEGMTSRPGHVFECDHVGFQAQRELGKRMYKKYSDPDVPKYFIDGNHDRWFSKANDANIVADFCDKMGYTYLGQDEGDLLLDKYGVSIKLWHGEDGNSYATSYRVQKIVEAFSGGEKPHVLLTGHTHKALYAQIRNIHCVSGGAMSRQSKWMRGKRIENHAGFWIIKMCLAKNDIKWFEPRFYSFYK